jgi:hypothetical protein
VSGKYVHARMDKHGMENSVELVGQARQGSLFAEAILADRAHQKEHTRRLLRRQEFHQDGYACKTLYIPQMLHCQGGGMCPHPCLMFVLELAAQVRWYVKGHKLLILQCNIHLVVTIHQIFCRPRRSRIWGDSTGCRKQEAKWEAVQTGAMLVAAQMVLGLEGKMLGDQENHIGRDEPNNTPTGKQP